MNVNLHFKEIAFFLFDVISHVNTAKTEYIFCALTSCEKTVFQYFIFGNNNIHTDVLLNGEQHLDRQRQSGYVSSREKFITPGQKRFMASQ